VKGLVFVLQKTLRVHVLHVKKHTILLRILAVSTAAVSVLLVDKIELIDDRRRVESTCQKVPVLKHLVSILKMIIK